MRVLVGPDVPLEELYAAPAEPWLRLNMVATVDGAATGNDGTSRSINNQPDQEVFRLLRAAADVILVGAGTLREEGYRPNPLPIVAVSRSGSVPPTLRSSPPGRVMLATCDRAAGLAESRDLLGDEHVLVLGSHRVDLVALREALVERGFRRILCEGGPHLLRDLLDQGVADEVCVTTVPRVIGGLHPRISNGPPVDVPLQLHALVEHEGTLLARWFIERR
ncbi:MAG: dihydrofolate reductase family protein [Nocardioides sp.]